MTCACQATIKVGACETEFGNEASLSLKVNDAGVDYAGILYNMATGRQDKVFVEKNGMDSTIRITLKAPTNGVPEYVSGVLYSFQVFEINDDPNYNNPLDMEVESPAASGTLITLKTLCVIFEDVHQ